jgi:hypothetical protein
MSMQDINLTLLTIKQQKIHVDILKYVAPYFNLNINVIDESLITTSTNSSDDK